ncbi:MAG: YceI family protein [Anaerolineaceae bacterium]|nr:YceI family protein [Anaerolineaceae bacterium]
MLRTLKIGMIVAGIVAAISIGSFLYLTRGVAAPTEAIQDSAQEMATSEADSSQTLYRISQDESQVTYTIQEVLNGADKTVVGATSQVAGDILVDISDPSQSELGEIRVNARTFATDDTRRDNAVARYVLQSESDANQYIVFQPTSISALPDSVKVGDSVTLNITGNLTIAGVTKEATFDVVTTLKSADQLTGSAELTVQRADFNLTIPNVPFVANVGDSVTLNLSFVANAVNA